MVQIESSPWMGGWAGVTCWVEETTTPLDLCHTPRIDDEEAAAPWIHHKEASAPWIYHRRTTTGGQCSMDPPRRHVGFRMGRGRRLHGSPLLRAVEGWRGEPHPAEQAEWTRRNEWRRKCDAVIINRYVTSVRRCRT
jgi:hypothetical protein